MSHPGSDVGYSSYVGMIPEDSVVIVFMSNLHRFVPYETPTRLGNVQVADQVRELYAGKTP